MNLTAKENLSLAERETVSVTAKAKRAPRRLCRNRASASLASLALIALLLAAGCGAQASGESTSQTSATRCKQHLASAGVHGRFAFIRDRGVSILYLPDCRTHVLVADSGASAPLSFSANGDYLAYGDGEVIAARGFSAPRQPLGKLSSSAWSPQGATLAGVSASGGVAVWRPKGKRRMLLPSGWGASSIAFSPKGDLLAVARTTPGPAGVPRENELWRVDLHDGLRTLLYRAKGIGDLDEGVAGFTPDGNDVLFWPDTSGSSSIAADGLPLDAVPVVGGKPRTLLDAMLAYKDYIADCGNSLLIADGPGRETNVRKSLALLSPPSYRAMSLQLSSKLSWTTPSCSEGGEIVTAAGESRQESHFGLEHRSIWLLDGKGARPRRLTTPRLQTSTDELPRISSNGRYLLYVAATRGNGRDLGQRRGTLWAMSLSGGEAKPIGPIAEIGWSGSYYGHYGWANTTAWHEG